MIACICIYNSTIVNIGCLASFINQTITNCFLEILPKNNCTESAYGLINQSIQYLRIAMPLLQNLLYISQCHQDRAFTHAVRPKQKGYWRDLNWLRVLKGAKVRQG